MKQYLSIFLFLTLFLTWCTRNNLISLDFFETSTIRYQQMEYLNSKIQNNIFSGSQNMDMFLQANWENNDFKFQSSFHISWDIVLWLTENELWSDFYTYFWDKKEHKETTMSWKLDYKLIKNNIYFNIQNIFIDIWKWNYQWDLLALISKNLESKRIVVKSQNKTQAHLEDIKFLVQTLSSLDVFNFIDQITYDSKLSYKIQINPDVLNDINSNTKYKISDFKWLLIVKSKSEVELKIEHLDLYWDKSVVISWLLWHNNACLSFKNMNIPDKSYNFLRNVSKKQISFTISQVQNYQELIKLNINFYPKTLHNILKNYIDWTLTISPLIIYWSDLEKGIEIDITGEQSFYEIAKHNISEPNSYIFFDQILWDEFSLQNILEENQILKNKN